MQVVGSVLVRDEDVFLERAIRNVAAFCDRIHVLDHLSSDRTPEILSELARELDHVEVVRSNDASTSHRVLERYAGTRTWVLGVDGDELYDPAALARLRADLEAGAHDDVFRLKAHVLNCDRLEAGRASGFLAPPSRPVTKLFNFAAVSRWTGCPERLHAGEPEFANGFDWESVRYLSEDTTWETDPLRLLHVCFLRRSSTPGLDPPAGRPSAWETGLFKRGLRGVPARLRYLRFRDRRLAAYRRAGRSWKLEWYAKGPRVDVDPAPFGVP
ncbi:MAG TPA: glycosyltransferase family 2 protein [Gaiellaceae bacterium]|nr:glycosyltransferase family 2 protein [Gaiellaceae bacterium]